MEKIEKMATMARMPNMARWLVSMFATAMPSLAFGSTFAVVNLDDRGPGSLRQAIIDANASPGADEIRFAGDLEGTITLTSGELNITDDLRIEGPDDHRLTVDGNNASRVFRVSGQGISGQGIEVAIRRLGIVNGLATDTTVDGPLGPVTLGGGLLNMGARVSLVRVTVANNHVGGVNAGGGGIANVFGGSVAIIDAALTENGASGSRGLGGAILNDGGSALYLRRVTCIRNKAAATVGALPDVDPSLVGSGQGGCISSNGGSHATVSRSRIEGNLAQGGNGANGGPGQNGGPGGVATGGAIRNTNYSLLVSDAENGTLDVAFTAFIGNQAKAGNGGDGGDHGDGGPGRNGVGAAIASGSETLGDLTATITDSWFIANRAIGGKSGKGGAGGNGGSSSLLVHGGAIQHGGFLTVENSLFVDNRAIGSDGGDAGAGGNGGAGGRAAGGAISSVTGMPIPQRLTVIHSTFRGNQAIGGAGGSGAVGGDGGPGHGGGFRFEGTPLIARGCVEHSQVTDNMALGGVAGRGGLDGKSLNGEGLGGGVWIDMAIVGLVATDVTGNFASTSDPDVFGEFSQGCGF